MVKLGVLGQGRVVGLGRRRDLARRGESGEGRGHANLQLDPMGYARIVRSYILTPLHILVNIVA